MSRAYTLVLGTLLLLSCNSARDSGPQALRVAAATNLTDVFGDIGNAFARSTGTKPVFSFASTAQLARQIENGAPFDVFAAADTEHIEQLARKNLLIPGTKTIYARGRLALWIPPGSALAINSLRDLTRPDVRFLAIAKPELAPYGLAAVETLRALGIWDALQPKIVYAESINMARQYASSRNADAAFTAYSLVIHAGGKAILVDERLHRPIDQGIAVLMNSQDSAMARRFVQFVLGSEGHRILESYGYAFPAQ